MDVGLRARISARIEKAEHKLRSAEILLESGEIEDAMSRAYYASYHAAMAILISAGLSARSHAGTVTLFSLHFVKTGLVDRRLGKALVKAREDRETGDYAEVSFFEPHEAQTSIDAAREMISEAKRITGVD